MKKIGIYLTGGGGKGSFQIGFFKALEELCIKPDIICGSSVGALVGGAATYLDSYEMLECWKNLTMESVLGVDSKKLGDLEGRKKTLKLWLETFISCCKPPILIDIDTIRKLLYDNLDAKSIIGSQIDFGITSTILPSFEYMKKFKKDMTPEDVLEYILASLYLPIFRPSKIIDGRNYLDIAIMRKYPLDMLKNEGCTDIILVDINGTNPRRMENAIQVTRFNENVNIIIINIPFNASLLDFTEEQTKKNFEMGYETSIRRLERTKNK